MTNDSAICWLLRPARRRVFEFLLPPVRRGVEDVPGVGVQLGATGISRIGMEHAVIWGEEDAQTVLLAEKIVRALVRLVLRLAAVIVFGRPNLRIVRHMEVIVEVRAEGRIPGN